MRFKLIILFVFIFWPLTAGAGIFDNIMNKAQQMAEETVDNVSNSNKKTKPSKSADASDTSTPAPANSKARYTTLNGDPTSVARQLALIRLAPKVLEKDSWLKNLAIRVDNERWQWVHTDEFRWRTEKEKVKAALLKQSREVPLVYHIKPWPSRTNMLTIKKYNFDRNAFEVITRTASGGWPWRSANSIRWLSVKPETAEKMVSKFQNVPRKLYGVYTLRLNDARITASDSDRMHVYWDDRIEQIDFYMLKEKGRNYQTESDDFMYVTSLDTSDFRVAEEYGRR